MTFREVGKNVLKQKLSSCRFEEKGLGEVVGV